MSGHKRKRVDQLLLKSKKLQHRYPEHDRIPHNLAALLRENAPLWTDDHLDMCAVQSIGHHVRVTVLLERPRKLAPVLLGADRPIGRRQQEVGESA